jgi:hypothetical protein
MHDKHQRNPTVLAITAKVTAWRRLLHQNAYSRILRHFSLNTSINWRLCSQLRKIFFANHLVRELQQDVPNDCPAASTIVADLFQVSKHAIASFDMIVSSDLTAILWALVQIME